MPKGSLENHLFKVSFQ
ncbi:hypothetical protein LINPERPRIM_LOCUS8952 [Linum perenne]